MENKKGLLKVISVIIILILSFVIIITGAKIKNTNVNIECAQGGIDAMESVAKKISNGESLLEAYSSMSDYYSDKLSSATINYGITNYELMNQPSNVVIVFANGLAREKEQQNKNIATLVVSIILVCACVIYLYKNKNNSETAENNLTE